MSIPPWQFRYFCYTESEGARRQPRPLLSFCFVVRLGICQSAEAKPQPEDSEGNQTRFAASWFSAESFSALAFPLSPPPFHGFIIPQWHVRVNWRREISPQKSQLFRTILKRLEHCPRRFVSFYLYLRPHQIIDRLCPVVVRRNRPHIGIWTL